MHAPDFLVEINPWRKAITRAFLTAEASPSPRDLQQHIDRTLLHQLFHHIARARGLDSTNLPAPPGDLDHAPTRRDFASLPPDILGRVYEHCLDHPIHLDSAGQPAIEQKTSARKSSGAFYTPARIVDYIVGQTLGRRLGAPAPAGRSLGEDWSIAGTLTPKILDPSCGSGSFLMAAYQHLLDRHLAQSRSKTLTPAERQHILLTHIHGVDIDPQAVELTKLSLTLLAIDSDSHGPLPNLDQNILCADALASADTFDWRSAFPDAFARGGFDCIIGNPPYLFGEHLDPAERDSLKARFPAAATQADAYQFFLELNGRLASKTATIGMLVPDAILARSGCKAIREFLLRSGLERVCHCGPVFGAGVSTAALIQSAGYTGPIATDDHHGDHVVTRHHCRRNRFAADPEHRLLIHASDPEHALLEKIATSSIPLGELGTLSRGEELGRKHLSSHGPVPILIGRDVSRYRIAPPTHFVRELRKPPEIYHPGKILIVKTGAAPVAAIDTESHATLQSLYNFRPHPDAPDPRYLLAIINSRLIAWWIRKTFTAYKKLFPQLNQETIAGLPVMAPETTDSIIIQSIIAAVDDAALSDQSLTTARAAIDDLVEQAFGLGSLESDTITKSAR